MSTLKVFLTTVVFASFQLFTFQAHAFEAWWQCSSRIGGDWTFGRAPYSCLVDHMQTQSTVKNQYGPILFEDARSRNTERGRYMNELNAVAKEMARFYLQKRKPQASEAEIQAFTKGLLTLMHQETVWSHFRVGTDNRVRYMRGDSGHGHGLMQVDDRSHQSALLSGKGVDLAHNMVYGLDIFYDAWQRAPSQSCVSSSSNYTARTRSAWAAYNGGPARICRWANPSSPFAHHDEQFLSKLRNQTFKSWISSETHKTDLNISCLVDGSRPCANTGSGPVVPSENEAYQIGDLFCRWGQSLYCVERLNDLKCLELADNRSYPVRGSLDEDQVGNRPVVIADRNQLCGENVQGLFEVSQQVELLKNINVRKTPGGELLTTASSGLQTRVLDFAVTSSSDQKRYYKINSDGTEGYVYAGDKQSFLEWVTDVEEPVEPESLIARVGDDIEVVAPFGINLRTSPGGRLLVRVPNSETVEVVDRIVQGSKNYLYYKVQYQNSVGYIYSGYLDDMETVPQWTVVVKSSNFLALNSSVPFRFLKACPSDSCDFTSSALRSGSELDQVEVLASQGPWVRVANTDKTKQGWILLSDLQEQN